MAKLFVRRRDGRIEVRLNELGRSVVRDSFRNVVAAEHDPNHDWHASLTAPIDPSLDHDNPVSMLNRQNETSTNAELASLTVDEDFLNEVEAWSWLTTLQVALRSTAQAQGILDEQRLATCDAELLEYIQMLQQFLFQLADCL
ncbi:MAG: hypothetical protein HKL86_03730 [Acidimicrobiaceae bacterium]|nr:hypothetical protein [Acidimicrobiaceae bacterium]